MDSKWAPTSGAAADLRSPISAWRPIVNAWLRTSCAIRFTSASRAVSPPSFIGHMLAPLRLDIRRAVGETESGFIQEWGREVRGALGERSRERRRGAILRAAVEVFSERGYFGARMRDVAARAGVADGTLYL